MRAPGGEAAHVEAHYGAPDLTTRILGALRSAGANPGALTREDLAPFEEFHTRGRDATRDLAAMLALQPGERLLDVGCGIGGPARTFAAEFGCTVVGVDLTAEHIRAATMLTELVGLAEQARFVRGDATALELADASADVAVLEHVTMNIADKRAVFTQLARVVRPGGGVGMFEICAGERAGGPHYPLPWATTPSISFLVPPDAYREMARDAGFTLAGWHEESEAAAVWFRTMAERAAAAAASGTVPPVGPRLIMGDDAREKVANLARSFEEGRVRAVMARFDRPAAGAA